MSRGLTLLLLPVLAACATSPAPAASEEGTVPLEQATAMCVRLHEEAARCTEPFIDQLLELRAKYDPAFAQLLADPQQREEIRRIGIAETLEDGTGDLARRQARCTEYARNGPPAPASDPSTLEACYRQPDCASRVACMRPVLERRMAARAAGAPSK